MECSPGDRTWSFRWNAAVQAIELATDDVSDRIEPFQEIMLADFDWMMILQG